jgi:hypothetical protein
LQRDTRRRPPKSKRRLKTVGEDQYALDGSKLAKTGPKKLFDQIIESRASVNRGGSIYGRQPVHRALPIRLKSFLFLSILIGFSFLILFEFPAIVGSVDRYLYCSSGGRPSTTRSIALVDSVGENWDPGLNGTIGQFARATGYHFDYYPFGQAGVDFFLHLPEKGYSAVLLRTHGSGLEGAITTSDSYDQNLWVGEQVSGSLSRIRVNGTIHDYFGFTPQFVAQMCGDFHGTLVIAMGCYTIGNTDLAAAFVKKGASAYVGWDNAITIDRTDRASAMLLQLLLEGNALDASVQRVMTIVGPDPTYGSQLSFFPSNEAYYRLPPAR